MSRPKLYLSDLDLAQRYSIHRSTMWRWCQLGKLPRPIYLNHSTRWRLADVERWEQQQQQGEGAGLKS